MRGVLVLARTLSALALLTSRAPSVPPLVTSQLPHASHERKARINVCCYPPPDGGNCTR